MTRFDDDNRIERSLLRSLFFPSPSTLPPPLPVVMSTRLRNLAKAHWNLARGQHYQHRYHRRWQCFFYQRASSQASDLDTQHRSSQKRSDPRNSDVEEDFLLEQRQALIHEPVHEHQHLECHAGYAGYPWSNSPPLVPAMPPTTSFMPPVAHASASEVSSS